MEDQLVWKEEFNIGVEIIDKEHQRLFSIINRLSALSEEERKSRRVCEEGRLFISGGGPLSGGLLRVADWPYTDRGPCHYRW